MEEKDRKDLRIISLSLWRAVDLRTFPNNRNLDIEISIALNNLGKNIEDIKFIIDKILEDDTKNLGKYVDVYRDARLKLEKELEKMIKTMEEDILSEIEEVERSMKDLYTEGGISGTRYNKFKMLMGNLRIFLGVEGK